jgi:hypothetical protein
MKTVTRADIASEDIVVALYVREVAKPRVCLVPYLENWSYDSTARALAKHLGHRFEFRLAYKRDLHGLAAWRPDLLVDFWWKGTLSERFGGHRVVKQVSSHRWKQRRFGLLTPQRMIKRHLRPCGRIVVPSLRLQKILAEASPLLSVSIGPKGFHPEQLFDYRARRGALTIGWAGSAAAKDKRVDLLLSVWPDLRLADYCLVQSEMLDFYNGADVIACASEAEGDPRPLIEGMACGCFPVTTDVGIVPELVRHCENGLIVEPTEKAFRDAFAWCRANVELVRAAGRENARAMLRHRTWAHAAPAWGDAFDAVLASGARAAG